MIDIDLLDRQLDQALTDELKARIKPLVRQPAAPPPRRAEPFVEHQWASEPPPEDEWMPARTPKAAPRPPVAREHRPESTPPVARPVAPPRRSEPTPAPPAPAAGRPEPAPPAPAARKPEPTPAAPPRRAEFAPAAPPRRPEPALPVARRPEPEPETVPPARRWSSPQPLPTPQSRWTPPSAMPPPFEADLDALPPRPRRRTLTSKLTFPPAPEPPAPEPTTATPRAEAPSPPSTAHHAPRPGSPLHRARAQSEARAVHGTRTQTGDYGRIVDLIAKGQLTEADALIAAHAAFATEDGTLDDRRDAARWAALRALLAGDRDATREASSQALALELADGPDGRIRHWGQHAWVVLEWGDERERDALLDHCREQAYRKDDLRWRSMLALVLARWGRIDEAEREFDATAERCLKAAQRDITWTDITTNLAEAAAYLGDARRASQINRVVAWPATGMVLTADAEVCKGSIARYRGLLAAATGRWAEADAGFKAAVDAHRRMGAELLLARTLQEWGRTLIGRDDTLARHYLEESSELARQLQLAEAFANH